ncbi:hypothetical protein ABIC94_003743 [Variovorax paradoxus]|uniref:hypothetical protein n=1 Tax=Variovorax paradoxus TaxID=34073 RepID=UPI003394F26C
MKPDPRDDEWQTLYRSLGATLSRFGEEDAYGKGDYWIVDDDYGDTSHKVCVSRLAFITPELVAAVQRSLSDVPHWRVLLQVDEEVNGLPASSTGLTVCFDSVEPHPSSRTRP